VRIPLDVEAPAMDIHGLPFGGQGLREDCGGKELGLTPKVNSSGAYQIKHPPT
jgi:hypothetical protein